MRLQNNRVFLSPLKVQEDGNDLLDLVIIYFDILKGIRSYACEMFSAEFQ